MRGIRVPNSCCGSKKLSKPGEDVTETPEVTSPVEGDPDGAHTCPTTPAPHTPPLQPRLTDLALARRKVDIHEVLHIDPNTGWRLVGFGVNCITKALERRPAIAGFVENELMNSTLRSQKTIARTSSSSQTSQVCNARVNRAHGVLSLPPTANKKSEAQDRPNFLSARGAASSEPRRDSCRPTPRSAQGNFARIGEAMDRADRHPCLNLRLPITFTPRPSRGLAALRSGVCDVICR